MFTDDVRYHSQLTVHRLLRPDFEHNLRVLRTQGIKPESFREQYVATGGFHSRSLAPGLQFHMYERFQWFNKWFNLAN